MRADPSQHDMDGMLELPRGSCRGAPPSANLRRVPLAIQVSKIPQLMGKKFARHIQSRAGSRTGGGESPAARHAREPGPQPDARKAQTRSGQDGKRTTERTHRRPERAGAALSIHPAKRSLLIRRFNGIRFTSASLLLAGNGRRQPRSCAQHRAPFEWRAGNGGRGRSSPKLRHRHSMVRSGGPSSPPNGGWGSERSIIQPPEPLPSSSSVASAAGRPTPLAVEIRPRGASGIPAAQYGGARTATWSGSSGTLARREGKMSQRRGRGRKKRSCPVTEHFRLATAPMTKQRGTVRAGKCVCVCVCNSLQMGPQHPSTYKRP